MPKLIILVILAALAGFGIYSFSSKSTPQPPPDNKQSKSAGKTKEEWVEAGIAIAGNYADADIVDLGNGTFRMYYSAEPEIPGFNGQVYSATSTDGIKWNQESGTRLTQATFPSVIKLSDGRYRMYFQDQQNIKSAISSDGLTWEKEGGARIDTKNPAGLTLTRVLAPTVLKTGNEYLMVYAGVINEPYIKEKVPNKETHPLLWATSKDGLIFEKKGMALDSRNEVFKGWMDGPELIEWDDNTIKLFFWGYFGVYESIFENGSFADPKFVFYGPNFDPNVLFPSSPPGDPTLMKINGVWNMYYGYHQKGIYRATLLLDKKTDTQVSFTIITGNITRSFKAEKYHNLSPDVYIEASDPTIVHVKKVGITWDDFFKTLPMKLTEDCLTTGDGETFCDGKNGSLKFYLNDKEERDLLEKQIINGDKILIKFK